METNPDHEQEPQAPPANPAIPQNAVLILEGVIVHLLKEAIINIGRKLENHVTIDDPRISRQHAQLRAINGHFVLFDLNSTGGTFVNGQRTVQCVLYPGDLISLAGVTLIYAQNDPALRSDQVETAPLGPTELKDLTALAMDQSTLDLKDTSQPQKSRAAATTLESRTGKYAPLEKYLRALPETQSAVTLTFTEVEGILNSKLPASAYEDRRWWDHETEGNHVNTRAWANAGWQIASVDVNAQQVGLVRAEGVK